MEKEYDKTKNKVAELVTDFIKECFVKNDEVETRERLLELVEDKMEYAFDDEEEMIYEIVEKALYQLSFEEIEAIYHGAPYEEHKEEEIKEEEKMENDLFNNVIKSADGTNVTVYLNGSDEKVFKKLKTFHFEESFYVLLENENNHTAEYYRYVSEMVEGEKKEKLFLVEDQTQISLFKFLGN